MLLTVCLGMAELFSISVGIAGVQSVAEMQGSINAIEPAEPEQEDILLAHQPPGSSTDGRQATAVGQQQISEATPQNAHQDRQGSSRQQAGIVDQEDAADPHDREQYLPDAIKLGLGDFIFYSVLVGRAAMYDMLTAMVSYIAVMAGLGTTLLLLALYKKALPALPISIGLGVLFYMLARLLLEPFVLNLSTNLVFV